MEDSRFFEKELWKNIMKCIDFAEELFDPLVISSLPPAGNRGLTIYDRGLISPMVA
jgi:hypothetical protein